MGSGGVWWGSSGRVWCGVERDLLGSSGVWRGLVRGGASGDLEGSGGIRRDLEGSGRLQWDQVGSSRASSGAQVSPPPGNHDSKQALALAAMAQHRREPVRDMIPDPSSSSLGADSYNCLAMPLSLEDETLGALVVWGGIEYTPSDVAGWPSPRLTTDTCAPRLPIAQPTLTA